MEVRGELLGPALSRGRSAEAVAPVKACQAPPAAPLHKK